MPPAGKVRIISHGRAPSDDSLSFHTPAPTNRAATATINIGAKAMRMPTRNTTHPLFGFCDGPYAGGGGGGHDEGSTISRN